VHFGEPQLPRGLPACLIELERRGAGAAIVAENLDHHRHWPLATRRQLCRYRFSADQLHDTLRRGETWLKSWISWPRSSME